MQYNKNIFFLSSPHAFIRRLARIIFALLFITTLVPCCIVNAEKTLDDAEINSLLIREAERLSAWQKANTNSYKVTTEILRRQDGNTEYYYRESSLPGDAHIPPKITPPAFQRKVKIISNTKELPTVPPQKKKPRKKIKKSVKQREVITYVDTVSIEGSDLPDYNAPVLSDKIGISDPMEGWNRVMFVIDEKLYTYFIGPLGKGYRYVVPIYARIGFSRMDHNIQMPKRLINNLLQGEFKGAGISFSRFLINTTVGLVGFYDPADEWFDFGKHNADTGQTMALWGVGDGCYVYMPLISSTSMSATPRDLFGAVIDDQLDPRAWIPFGGSSIRFLMKFNNMSLNIDTVERLQKENLDPYVIRRDIGYLMRKAEISNFKKINDQ